MPSDIEGLSKHQRRSGYSTPRRRICRFCVEEVINIDFKDVRLLQNYILERGKILSRRISGNCAFHQRMLVEAIKRARSIALLNWGANQAQATEVQNAPENSLKSVAIREEQEAERIALAETICGKYAFVPTSSDAFSANKSEEIRLEDRPR